MKRWLFPSDENLERKEISLKDEFIKLRFNR